MGYSPFYLIGQAFKNIWRNKGMSITALFVLIACLVVTGSFFTVTENINKNIDDIGDLNTILSYIDENAPDEDIRSLKEQVENLEGVKRVTLITKEEALENEKKNLGKDVFKWLEEGENPYRASFEIEYEADTDVKTLETNLKKLKDIDTVVSRSDTAEKVNKVKNVISKVFLGVMTLLFVASLFIVITAIHMALTSRRKEIGIMRYVGSTGFFITVPYLLEGVIIGAVSAGISYLVMQYLYSFLSSGMEDQFFGLIFVLPFSAFRGVLLGAFFGIGILTGLLGSFISVVRYLSK